MPTESPLRVHGDMAGLHFKILSTPDEISTHLEEWKDVATDPMAHPDVVLRLCESDPNITKPFIPILVDDEGRIACMFSSRIEREYIGRDCYLPLPKAKVRKLTIPTGGIFGRDKDEHVAKLLELTAREIKKEKVDIIELPFIDKNDLLLDALNNSSLKSYQNASLKEQEHWRLELAEDFDRQMLLLGKSTRSTLRHNLNRFNRIYEGRFEIRLFSRMEEVDDALALCEKIDMNSYHKGLGVNIRNDPRTNAVYKGLAAQGGLEISILFIDGQPLAFLNSAVIKNKRIGTQMGFDPTFCKYPLGTILLYETARRYIETGRREVWDFGIGKADYKSRLCSSMVLCEQRQIPTRRAIFNPFYIYMMIVYRLGIASKSLMTKLKLEEFARKKIRSLHKQTKRST